MRGAYPLDGEPKEDQPGGIVVDLNPVYVYSCLFGGFVYQLMVS